MLREVVGAELILLIVAQILLRGLTIHLGPRSKAFRQVHNRVLH